MGDVSRGIQQLVKDPTSAGRTYEFVGPFCYKIGELVEYMMEWCHRGRDVGFVRGGIGPWFSTKVNISEAWIKFWKYSLFGFTWDMIERHEAVSDILTGEPTLKDLGIDPTVFELWAPQMLQVYDMMAHYHFEFGEAKRPPFPKHYDPITRESAVAAAGAHEPLFKGLGTANKTVEAPGLFSLA